MKIKKSILYYDNGNIRDEWWHKEGDRDYWHKEDGPAFIRYYLSGEKELEAWWVDDERHKIDGPACIFYDPDGTIIDKEYWINNIGLTKEQWEDHPIRQEWLIKEAMKKALK